MRQEHSLIPSRPSCLSGSDSNDLQTPNWVSSAQASCCQLFFFIFYFTPGAGDVRSAVDEDHEKHFSQTFICIAAFLFFKGVWFILAPVLFVCGVCISFPDVFREGRRVRGAGGSSRGGPSSGNPADRLGPPADEEPSCSLAAHHRHCHHGVVSALRPQCGTLRPLSAFEGKGVQCESFGPEKHQCP